jgi:hypothetical protein
VTERIFSQTPARCHTKPTPSSNRQSRTCSKSCLSRTSFLPADIPFIPIDITHVSEDCHRSAHQFELSPEVEGEDCYSYRCDACHADYNDGLSWFGDSSALRQPEFMDCVFKRADIVIGCSSCVTMQVWEWLSPSLQGVQAHLRHKRATRRRELPPERSHGSMLTAPFYAEYVSNSTKIPT